MESLSSLKAFWPQALQNQNIFRNESLEKQKILGLIINALDVVPPLPYYLATDLWRINALQEIDLTLAENGAEITTLTPSQTLNVSNEAYYPTKAYDSANLTSDWWNYREQYQGIGSPDGKQYEDYLQDKNIIWNKPYLRCLLNETVKQLITPTFN